MRTSATLDLAESIVDALILRWAARIIRNVCENPYYPSTYDTGDIDLPLSIRVDTVAEKLVPNIGGEQ